MVKTDVPVKILLVDDTPANRLTLEAVLEKLGVSLVKANSGEEALHHIARDNFAAILMDVRMPEMDGFETAATISRSDPSRKMPIIFLTAAQGSEKERAQAYSVGGIDYLLKPFVPSELRTKVSILSDLYRRNGELLGEIGDLKRDICELNNQNLKLKTEMNEVLLGRT
jgi:CheY-like chemotaxis protein